MKKKLLFLFIGVGVSLAGFAQMNAAKKLSLKASDRQICIPDNITPTGAPGSAKSINASAIPPRYHVGNSQNLYGNLTSEQTIVTANQDINVIMMTHRTCVGTGNIGWAQCSYSTNGGTTWDSTVARQVLSNSTYEQRYPGGVIYNPTGNTNKNNAFAVATGPYHISSVWTGGFYASERLDNTLNNEQYIDGTIAGATNGNNQFPRVNLQATTDGTVHVISVDSDVNSTGSNIDGFLVNKGTFSSGTNSFVWTFQEITHNFATDPSDGSQMASTYGNLAFSEDGTIGYVVLLGVSATGTKRAYQPIVYKSINSGATWNAMPIPDFSSSVNNYNGITKYLRDAMDGSGAPNPLAGRKPLILAGQGIDCTVDKDNQLHILCTALSSFRNTDALDSVGFTYLVDTTHVFDLFTTNCGNGWDAIHVASLQTDRVDAAQSWWTDAGYDARLQIGRTPNGEKIFYLFGDTDTILHVPSSASNPDYLNLFPDVFGRGYDVVNKKTTPLKNFTGSDPNYGGKNWWISVSDVVLKNGSTYKIPVTTTNSRSVDGSGFPTLDGTNPVQHYFIDGITFDESEFTTSVGVDVALIKADTCTALNIGELAFISATGGVPPYSFIWSTGATTAVINGLAPGNYTISVYDNTSCLLDNRVMTVPLASNTLVTTYTVDQTPVCTAPNGGLSISVTGGGLPYSYSWSNGATTTSIAGIVAGAYTVTTTDFYGCTNSPGFNLLSQDLPPILTESHTDATGSCGDPTGDASVSASGGTSPYLYAWNTGGTNNTITGISAGLYSVVVTDANGCTATKFSSVMDASASPVSFFVTSPSCFGGSNGSLMATVSGAVTPVYTWSNGETTATINGLISANYGVTILSGACTSVGNVLVPQPTPTTAAASIVGNVLCKGGATGQASVTGSGGTAPYTYLWSFASKTNAIATGLAAGTYTVYVTDANVCSTGSTTITVTEPATALSIALSSVTNQSVVTPPNGRIIVTANGGTPAYSYTWTATGGLSGSSGGSNIITGLKGGNSTGQALTYAVTVTDANGCKAILSGVNILRNSINEFDPSVTAVNVYPNPTNGELSVNFTSSSFSPVTVKVTSVNGQVVYNEDLKPFNGEYRRTIDLGKESNGVYFLQIATDKGLTTKKVVKL